ncbi:MAG TPA: HNH endonuclease [Kofleriaceae bacterium]|nr:HNH endonuclease [Kofleriaceae bacterium]
MLSPGYEPVKIVSWQRAITLLFLGKVEVIEEYNRDIKSTSLVIKIPAVVRLLAAIRRHKQPVKFSRVNIYGRDRYTCQYCGARKAIAELTYDHVVPRSAGGKTTWTNIVTACETCNRKKANRTPEQAGMRLLAQPVQPKAMPSLVITVSKESMPDAWRDYLYWTGELEHD